MIDRAAFFASVRASLFGGVLHQPQVDGLNAILDEWERRKLTDLRWLAYIFATVHRETGAKFQPVAESLNYSVSGLLSNFSRSRISEAHARRYGRNGDRAADQVSIGNLIYGGQFGIEQLGNDVAGDGYRYRGRGLAQITGKRNYRKFGQLLGVDLVSDPDRALELGLSVAILFEGMIGGLFTGRKLSEFFPAGGAANWFGARRVVNGTDRAQEIADNAGTYYLALQAASLPDTPAPPAPRPRPEPPRPRQEPPQPDDPGAVPDTGDTELPATAPAGRAGMGLVLGILAAIAAAAFAASHFLFK